MGVIPCIFNGLRGERPFPHLVYVIIVFLFPLPLHCLPSLLSAPLSHSHQLLVIPGFLIT